MRVPIRAALATLVLAVLTGLVYPLVMTGFGQIALHHKADGSLVTANGRNIGSLMIGQLWQGPRWFYGRPSAVSYDASTSSGTNLGPNSRPLAQEIRGRVLAIEGLERPYHSGLNASQIPVDLLTASGSGLDPDISPAAAMFQAPRVAAVRHVPLARVQALIRSLIQGRTLGFLGEPRVNVLDLNLALQHLSP